LRHWLDGDRWWLPRSLDGSEARVITKHRPGLGQVAGYERGPGLFAENAGLAQWLADGAGIPCEQIRVTPVVTAADQGQPSVRPALRREAPRFRLLLCAGGDRSQPTGFERVRLVLDALDILREHDPRVRLTVGSLEKRPADGTPRGGVTFRGVPMVAESVALFDSHDLLVAVPGSGSNGLPEAFSRGIPCVAVRGSALSEAITQGVTGAVVGDATAPGLAAVIATVLADDDIYRNCFERAPAMTAYFSWERAAGRAAEE
jgi:glycosyltransferase involved in cell wall biosynthesis